MRDEDDFIAVVDDSAEIPATVAAPWRILVVDDDPEVHVATDFALQGVAVCERPLALIHANSASAARRILENDRDFAVVLLDVVMETEDAGLQMVRYLRECLGMAQTRIVLRTGQPGYAPELQVFHDYDINDYRTKAELTRTRLITAITAAVRSYHQIHTIAENKRNLEMLMQASSELVDVRAADRFAAHVLASIGALLAAPLDAVFCARQGGRFGRMKGCYVAVIGACGALAPLLQHPLGDIADPEIAEALQSCLESGKHAHRPAFSAICVNHGEHQGAIFLRTSQPLNEQQRQTVEIFAANVAASLGTIQLFEQLNFFAYHDELTHLRNRNRFILDLNDAGSRGADSVVALLDLQHFADLNDGLGHETGNALLVAVSRRLQEKLGQDCLLARIGADVFGLIGPENQINPARLFELFATPFRVHEHALPVNAMIGLCRTLEDKPSGITLLKRTNIALNRAKNDAASSHAYFMPEMEDSTRWRLEIIHKLRADFAADRLSVWYQPQVDLATGKLAGIEALLRWPGQRGGEFIQPPNVFVPLAEYSGLIIEIGDWVLDRACAAFAELRPLAGAPARVAVNVSVAQFRQMGLPQRVAETMSRHAIGAGELELEITESIAMDEPKIVAGALLAIKSTGSRIAVDDFGTGYSSLAQLRQLPIDAIKIDRSFIAEIAHGRGGMFAETITALSEKLGVETIAEGVETDEQAGFLRGLGCNTAQGFLYARPMPLEELKDWIASHRPWR